MESRDRPDRPNYEYRVGLFVVIALILLFWGWSWLKGFSFHAPQKFKVQFNDIAGLTKNAPVQVNGVRVGTVEKIELNSGGQVICSLSIPAENTIIPQGSMVTIQTLGLVGAKYVEISLPKVKTDEPMPPPIEPDSLIIGQDPVRVELHMNRIATNFSRLSECFSDTQARESITKAARDSGTAMENIKDAAFKFRNNMDRLSEATTDIRQGAVSARGFFNQGTSTMQGISTMAKEWQNTGRKLNHLVDEPGFNSNVKQTVQLAKETASKIQEAIHELNSTLADKNMRGDMISILDKLRDSTENIDKSMQVVRQLADDQGLRTDLREAMSNAKEAMTKANEVLSNPNLVTDARETMAQLRTASAQVSKMAQTINKLLGKKHPLMRMFFSSAFGSSGNTETETTTVTDSKKKKTKSFNLQSKDETETEKTTKTEIIDNELNPSTVDKPQSTEAIQMHGEIK